MKPQELQAALTRDGLGPLYCLVGEEPYLRDSALSTIRAVAERQMGEDGGSADSPALLSDDDPIFNCDVVYGDETDALEILSIVQETSFFAARRFVVVAWAEKLSARDGERLLPYLEHPLETTTLVFVAAKLDGRLKWVQQLKKRAITVDCAPPFENQRLGWVRQQAAHLGLRLDASAVHAFNDLAAEGLYITHHEMQKLSAYLPDGTPGRAADVEAIRGMEPGTSVFDLSVAIGQRNTAAALRIVANNLDAGEAPLRILGALVWQVRRIWKAKLLSEQGVASSQLAKQLGVPPFRASEFLKQARQWSEPQLRLAWERFWHADSALKGYGSTSPRRVLDLVVMSLCMAEGPQQASASTARR